MKQHIQAALLSLSGLSLALAVLLAPVPARAALQAQAIGENLVIRPPANWRLAYADGDPSGDYVIEFMPPNERQDSWREGYMSVRRGTYKPTSGAHLAPQVVQEVLRNAQRICSGHFTSMQQKDSMTNGAYTSISGGFCDRPGNAAPYGEGSLIAVVEGTQHVFLVQFGWRPATETEAKSGGLRISPEKLQQYLNLVNQAVLCGGEGQPLCPR
jgi:hypothetical protein